MPILIWSDKKIFLLYDKKISYLILHYLLIYRCKITLINWFIKEINEGFLLQCYYNVYFDTLMDDIMFYFINK